MRVRCVSLCAAIVVTLLASPAASQAASAEVVIDSSLHPTELRVEPGTRVTWRNAHDQRHRVRSTSGPAEFDSGNLDPGATFSVTLSGFGTYRYVDDRDRENSAYWGTIVVEAGAQPAPPPPPPSGGSPPANSPPTGGGTAPPGPAQPPAPSTAAVSIANRAFNPSTVRVATGGSVSWQNQDDRPHTVTARDGSFDSGIFSGGHGFRRDFPAAGTFAYFCQLHPEMTGTVEVVSSDGSVPPPVPGGEATPASAGGTAPSDAPQPAGGTAADATAGQPATASSGASSAGSGAAAPATATVRMTEFSFQPPSVTVAVNGTVTWRNAGVAPHTASATDGSFDSKIIEPNGTFSQQFSRPGTFAYQCNLHPQMKGTVQVQAPGQAAPPSGPSGRGAAGTAEAGDQTQVAGDTSGAAGGRTRSVSAGSRTRSSSDSGGSLAPLAGAGLAGLVAGVGTVAGGPRLLRRWRLRRLGQS